MTTEPRRLSLSYWLLGLASGAMMLLAGAFYGQSVESVASGKIRGFVGAITLAALLPFAWILLQLLRGRRPAALLSGLTCALLYLLGFGWLAVLLFLFSWGDMTFWIPAMGLPVQLLALGAGIAGWRALEVETRRKASRLLGIGVPIALIVLPLAFSSLLRRQIEQLPAQRKAQSVDAEQLVSQMQECLLNHAARGRGYPSRLEDVPEEGVCANATLLLFQSRGQTVLHYRTVPATPDGVRRAFTLCAQPTEVPDQGMVTVVGDDTGVLRKASANDAAREPVRCEVAWGGGATGAVKRLQSCLMEFTETHSSGFPNSLDELNTALPRCMTDSVVVPSGNPYELVLRATFDINLGVQYLPADSDSGGTGTIAAYQLFAQCPGRVDKAIINERNELLDAESAATRWWLNECQDPEGVDARLLAQRAGYRIGADNSAGRASAAVDGRVEEPTVVAGSNSSSINSPPTVPAPRIEPAPDFGATPDLPARRAECRASVRGCYGLALELERTVHLDGGNPSRDETLSVPHRALAEEANRAYASACRGGDVRACHAQADVLLNGRAAAEDLPKALALFEQGCRGGYALSCIRVGELRERGRQASRQVSTSIRATPEGKDNPIVMSVPDASRAGIVRDVAASVAAYRAACALGEGAECLRAARVILEPGASAEPERRRAIAELSKYCAGGQAYACELLAQTAEAGNGEVAGQTTAQWRRRACRLGERGACVEAGAK